MSSPTATSDARASPARPPSYGPVTYSSDDDDDDDDDDGDGAVVGGKSKDAGARADRSGKKGGDASK